MQTNIHFLTRKIYESIPPTEGVWGELLLPHIPQSKERKKNMKNFNYRLFGNVIGLWLIILLSCIMLFLSVGFVCSTILLTDDNYVDEFRPVVSAYADKILKDEFYTSITDSPTTTDSSTLTDSPVTTDIPPKETLTPIKDKFPTTDIPITTDTLIFPTI